MIAVVVDVGVTGNEKSTGTIEQCRLALLLCLAVKEQPLIVAVGDGVSIVQMVPIGCMIMIIVVIIGIRLVVAVDVISGKLETRAAQ